MIHFSVQKQGLLLWSSHGEDEPGVFCEESGQSCLDPSEEVERRKLSFCPSVLGAKTEPKIMQWQKWKVISCFYQALSLFVQLDRESLLFSCTFSSNKFGCCSTWFSDWSELR